MQDVKIYLRSENVMLSKTQVPLWSVPICELFERAVLGDYCWAMGRKQLVCGCGPCTAFYCSLARLNELENNFI